MDWTRAELAHLVELRHRAGLNEGNGVEAFIDLRLKITPELLEAMLGGTWTAPDGKTARLDGVHITDDGYAEPILTKQART
jgi:hypothetical protein